MIWPQVGLFLLPQIGFEIRQQRYSLIDGYLVASLVPTSSWLQLTYHLLEKRVVITKHDVWLKINSFISIYTSLLHPLLASPNRQVKGTCLENRRLPTSSLREGREGELSFLGYHLFLV